MDAHDSADALAANVADFRRFNRTYTRFIGVLDEELLRSGFSLAEARVLYELATRQTPTAKEIAEALSMDAAYLSRILGRFERASLVSRTASKKDARSATLTLTRRGRAKYQKLARLSDTQAAGLLEALPVASQVSLIGSMQVIESILAVGACEGPSYRLRPHRLGDMGLVVQRESLLYAEEYGFDETFEALVARIVSDFLAEFDAACERCWIAEIDGQHAGHIFLVKHPTEPGTAKLRLLMVEASARGLGLGSALVAECVKFARAAGYRKITLWTQSILLGARRIYQNAGFRLVEEQSNRRFGQDLVSQTWELNLTD